MKRIFRIKVGYAAFLIYSAFATLEFVRTKDWMPLVYFGSLALVFVLLEFTTRPAKP